MHPSLSPTLRTQHEQNTGLRSVWRTRGCQVLWDVWRSECVLLGLGTWLPILLRFRGRAFPHEKGLLEIQSQTNAYLTSLLGGNVPSPEDDQENDAQADLGDVDEDDASDEEPPFKKLKKWLRFHGWVTPFILYCAFTAISSMSSETS